MREAELDWTGSGQPLSSVTTAGGLATLPHSCCACCKYDLVFDKCEGAGVILPRALFEGAGEG